MNFRKPGIALAFSAIISVGLGGFTSATAALILNAGNSDCQGYRFPPGQDSVMGAFVTACSATGATELYKSNQGGAEEGTYKDSYSTSYSNRNTASVEHILGQAIISYDEMFLAVKTGNHNPNFYGWNISNWNGTESISVTAFLTGGDISNLTIWGRGERVSVPEPGTLALLGAGLLGLGLMRRKRAR